MSRVLFLFLTFLVGTAGNNWHIEIWSNNYMNLREVEAYAPDGSLVSASSATFSNGLYGHTDPASHCIDGDTDNMCRSNSPGKGLIITYLHNADIAEIVVRNAKDQNRGRIADADIFLKYGSMQVWSSTFVGVRRGYIFRPQPESPLLRLELQFKSGVYAQANELWALDTAGARIPMLKIRWSDAEPADECGDGDLSTPCWGDNTGVALWATLAPGSEVAAVHLRNVDNQNRVRMGMDTTLALRNDSGLVWSTIITEVECIYKWDLIPNRRPNDWYIEIWPDTNRYMNLREVEAYASNGSLVSASDASFSHCLYGSTDPASHCIDGDTDNMCRSGSPNKGLIITYPHDADIAEIVVRNDKGYNKGYIENANIFLKHGQEQVWNSKQI